MRIYQIDNAWEDWPMETKDFRRKNLRALMEVYLHEGKTKAQFADAIGLPASQLSQLVSANATRNIGDIIARRVESNLGMARGWLDVPRSEEILDAGRNLSINIDAKHTFSLQNLSANYTDHPYRLELMDVRHSCGGGAMNSEYPDIIQSIEVDPEYAKRMFGGRPSSSLKLTTSVGDSMLGTIEPGELVVIDVTVKNFMSDGIYAFTYCDSSHIKRLQMLRDRIVIISDNQKYERWEIDYDNEDNFHIEGFVVGKWHMDYSRLG